MRFSLVALMCVAGSAFAAQPPSVALDAPSAASTLQYDALDLAKLQAEDTRAALAGQPRRYAVTHRIKSIEVSADTSSGGEWTTLVDGRLIWRLPIRADGAVSIDVGFSRLRLPQGAELWLSDTQRSVVRGPYTDADNPRSGILALPMVPGSEAVLELIVPADKRELVDLQLGFVNHGYRSSSAADAVKSGTCNVDTGCAQGDAWRQQIRSAAHFTFTADAGLSCTGQLVNRSNGDRAPLFLTANHCLKDAPIAATVVVYWKYESPTCREVNSGANGNPLPLTIAAATQSGAALLATYAPSDMTLLRLSQAPPALADAYWSGWDRRNLAPTSAVTIHHPQGHEKRISFENDALAISDYEPTPAGDATTHLKVFDWDVGTTESRSSGAALWNADKRIVGTLHGGFAACGNNDADYYGRLFTSWTGGGTDTTRLSNHLDPIASGAETVNGTGTCNAPTLTLTTNADPVIAGSDVLFTATASGGAGGYSYSWDIDGDGVIDKKSSTNTLSARFNREVQFNASVIVADSLGCESTAQRAVSVVGHRVRLQAALGQPTQVCGDNDATIEPGERWRLDTQLVNAGQRATSAEALSLFAKSGVDSVAGALRDQYGYAVTDSTQGGQCDYQYIDITNQVPALQLTASGSFPANDDGRTGVIDLAAVNGAFNFYGQTVSQVVMSTNGYIGTSAATTGGDFTNLCGATPSADNNGGRLQVMHDDLVAGSLRWASFAQCPRPSTVAPFAQRCLVFQWNNAGVYAGSTATGDFDFQAVVYPQTWQIIYQYRNSIPGNGETATVGILNPAVAGQQLTSSCNQPQVTPLRAVCFYHPQHLPASADITKLRMENPLVDVGSLQPAATKAVSTFFAVDPAATCGSRYRIGLAGTADDNSGNFSTSTFEFLVGDDGNCNVSNSCAVSLPPVVNLRPGVFFNPRRAGNGLVSHVVPVPGQLPIFFAAWYTGNADRTPTWYIVQGQVQDNQVVAPILRVTRDVAAGTFSVDRQTVGSARVHFVSAEKILFNYFIDATSEGGSEILSHGFQGLASGTPNRTGTWFYGQEDGWGQTYDSYVANTVAREFITTYLYDSTGQPRWVLTDAAAADTGDLPTNAYQVHCPSCGWIDFFDSVKPAGSMRRSFVAPNSGTLSTTFTLPLPMLGTWNRNQVPISILTPVLPEQQ
ncbi:MAG: PKD domain-containing protein [Rhodanobacteraceae bacterium]|nr:PKD domain-containing protein [Rhodanobacteraceae bacterium]